MRSQFIYVFSTDALKALKNVGLQLVKADENNCIFVFENRNDLNFGLFDFDFVFSNILTF